MIERFVNGRIRSNAYLFVPEGSRDAIVVDPGSGAAAKIVRRLTALNVAPRAVLLTHGHTDHTSTARELAERYGIPVYLHMADWRWLDNPMHGGYLPVPFGRMVGRIRRIRPPTLQPVDGWQTMTLAGTTVQVLHTPGHTAGSCSFVVGPDVCFSGDTLFAGGIGRAMVPGGERRALRRSVRELLLPLADNVRLCPGHGRESTVGAVRHLL